MVSFGYTLSSEEHGPAELVDQRAARRGGRVRLRVDLRPLPPVGHRAGPQPVRLDGARRHRRRDRADRGRGRRDLPDHAHPSRRSSPRRRRRRRCCSTAGSSSASARGEALNEHILGDRWPPADVRLEMLEEAVEVIRALWTGDTVDHRGELLRGRERQAVRPAGSRRRRSSSRRSARRPRSSPAASATATGAPRRQAEIIEPYVERGRHRAAVRAAQRLLGRGRRRRAPQDRARRLAQRRHHGPAVAGPADVDALRAGRADGHRGRGDRVGAVRPRRRAVRRRRSGSTSTPATTTSTSTRSAPTRTGSSASGRRSCSRRSVTSRRRKPAARAERKGFSGPRLRGGPTVAAWTSCGSTGTSSAPRSRAATRSSPAAGARRRSGPSPT